MVTQRLSGEVRLRPLEEHHVTDLHLLIESNRDFLAQWVNWIQDHRSIEASLYLTQEAVRQFANNRGLTAGIWYDDKLIGCVGHEHIDWKNETGQLSFWIAEKYQGAGLATRSVRSLIKHSFYRLGLTRLEIHAGIENIRAGALAERLGFQREGIRREALLLNGERFDVYVYGLLEREWRTGPLA